MFVIKIYIKVVLNFLLNLSKVTKICQNYIPAKSRFQIMFLSPLCKVTFNNNVKMTYAQLIEVPKESSGFSGKKTKCAIYHLTFVHICSKITTKVSLRCIHFLTAFSFVYSKKNPDRIMTLFIPFNKLFKYILLSFRMIDV